MAANLSLVMDDTDKVRALYADTLDQKLAILPPDINQSAYRFEPVDAKTLRYGLGGIKGTGEQARLALLTSLAVAAGRQDILNREVQQGSFSRGGLAELRDDYARVYGLAEQVYAGWGDYRQKTDLIGRRIPVFRLTPR